MVFDGWSVAIFVRELATFHRAFGADPEVPAEPLEPLSVQYADLACWQRQLMSGYELDAQLAWWREQLGSPAALPDLSRLPERGGAASGAARSHAWHAGV